MKKTILMISVLIMAVISTGCDKKTDIPAFLFLDYKDGVELYRYNSDDKKQTKAEIPSEYEGKPVIKIEDEAFLYTDWLEQITISENIEEIGDYSFGLNKNTKVINESNKIKSAGRNAPAFEDTSRYNLLKNNPEFKVTDDAVFSKDGTVLISYNVSNNKTEYTVPKGVKTVAKYAFLNAKYLEKVVISEGVETLENEVFFNCAKTTDISFPKSLKHMEADSVHDTGWYKNQKGEVIINGKFLIKESEYVGEKYQIPEGVTHLLCGFDDYEQDDDTLPCTSVLTLPRSLEYISPDIDLHNISLYYIEDGNENFVIDYSSLVYNKDKTKLLRYANGAEKSLVLDDNIKAIGESAFALSEVEKITLPANLESIGEYAFSTSDLRKVNIPDKIKNIEKGLFNSCLDLKEFKVPDTIERIENDAFGNIDDLTITIPDSVKYIHPGAFDNSEGLKIIGKKGSFAEMYSEMFDYDFEEID